MVVKKNTRYLLQSKVSFRKCSLGLIILLVLITFLSAFSNNYYKVFAGKHDGNDHGSFESQHSSQKSYCKAGEDNNNSCNNISISRQGGDGNGDNGNKVQVSKQGSSCEAGEDNNNSCNNISISRQGGDGNGDNGNKFSDDMVQVSKQGSSCEAGEDNNNSCNNFDLQDMIKTKIDLLSQNRA